MPAQWLEAISTGAASPQTRTVNTMTRTRQRFLTQEYTTRYSGFRRAVRALPVTAIVESPARGIDT